MMNTNKFNQNKFINQLPKPIAIVGMAVTGESVYKLLLQAGVEPNSVLRYDDKKKELSDFESPEELMSKGQPKTLCVSPGVALSTPWIQNALSKNQITLTSECEIAHSFLTDEKIIAITGSIGKSTTTALIGHGLLALDKNCFMGGNLGIPLAQYVLDLSNQQREKAKFIVLELSSYQLENFKNLNAEIGIFTYLTANHLERYPNKDSYYQSKWNMIKHISKTVILNSNGGDLKNWSQTHPIHDFSKQNYLNNHFTTDFTNDNSNDSTNNITSDPTNDLTNNITSDLSNNFKNEFKKSNSLEIIWGDRTHSLLKTYDLKNCELIGSHNQDNMALAAITLEALKAPPICFESLKKFKGLAHRVENLGFIKGIRFINDSKATTIESVITATTSTLETVPVNNKLYLLVGGKDKNLPWEDLNKLNTPDQNPQLKFIFFGECGSLAQNKSSIEGPTFKTLKEAIIESQNLALPGDSVLLSPGGTSLDEFKNFEARGDFFKQQIFLN